MGTCCSGDVNGHEVTPIVSYFLVPGAPADVYELGPQIGKGAYAAVVEGMSRPSRSGRPAHRAIKVLQHDRGKGKGNGPENMAAGARRAAREVAMLADLSHPNVVRLYEVYEAEGATHAVMEMCRGGSLLRSVLDGGRFPEAQAASTMLQVFKAVRHLHHRRLAHRDLKCENFLWHDASLPIHERTLKLVDFGTTRRFAPGEFMTSAVGTPLYVSPEIVRGKYTESCDLWACGCMLYIMIAGHAPFQGKTNVDTYRLIVQASARFRKEEWGEISAKAKELVGRLLIRPAKLRLTAVRALEHPWLLSREGVKAPLTDAEMGAWLEKRLVAFGRQGVLKRLVVYLFTHLVREEDAVEARRVFEQLDSSGRGEIAREDFEKYFAGNGPAILAMDRLRLRDSATLDYRAFVAVTMDAEYYQREDVLLEAFSFVGGGKAGYIDSADFDSFLLVAGQSPSWKALVRGIGAARLKALLGEELAEFGMGDDEGKPITFDAFRRVVFATSDSEDARAQRSFHGFGDASEAFAEDVVELIEQGFHFSSLTSPGGSPGASTTVVSHPAQDAALIQAFFAGASARGEEEPAPRCPPTGGSAADGPRAGAGADDAGCGADASGNTSVSTGASASASEAAYGEAGAIADAPAVGADEGFMIASGADCAEASGASRQEVTAAAMWISDDEPGLPNEALNEAPQAAAQATAEDATEAAAVEDAAEEAAAEAVSVEQAAAEAAAEEAAAEEAAAEVATESTAAKVATKVAGAKSAAEAALLEALKADGHWNAAIPAKLLALDSRSGFGGAGSRQNDFPPL